MFTGIVEETGTIKKIERTRSTINLALQTRSTGRDMKLGDSLAVNGCCLTATELTGPKTK